MPLCELSLVCFGVFIFFRVPNGLTYGRVVLVLIITATPLIDPKLIFDSYACRKDKGVHKAVMRYQNWSAQYLYVLKLDVSRYFPSIDHPVLKQKLARFIKDKQLLWLLNVIIDTSPTFPVQIFPGNYVLPGRRTGIPTGNLTSQFFANLYLHDIDHMTKETLNIKPYLRYVDDLIILARNKSYLWEIKQAVARKLEQEHLLLHPRKSAPVNHSETLLLT